MSPGQLAKQLRKILRDLAWSDSPAAAVFGTSVYLLADIGDGLPEPGRLPCAYVVPMATTADEDDGGLLRVEYGIVVFAQVEGDPYGEAALVGGPSGASARAGNSQGRGLLEIEVPLLTRLALLTGADGAPVLVTPQGAPAVTALPDKRLSALYRAHKVTALCTVADEYPAPQNLTVDVSTPGQATLAWTLPAARFDRYSIIVNRASGATAPTTATGGTPVTVSGATATSVTVTGLSAGVHSFAVWEAYDDLAPVTPATARRYSDQVVGSYQSGTVT